MTEIIHAGDPDDEGQLLVDEVLEYAGNTKPVKRVLINDNTLPGLIKPGRMEQQHHLQENQPQLKRQQQMIKKRLHRCPLTWYDFSST